MKFQLGEFVRFVDEKREGYITKIFNEEMVGVTGDDDFEIPAMINNLTHVHGHSSTPEKQPTINTASEISNFREDGVFIAVLPDENKSAVVHFYIVNDSNYQLLVSLKTAKNNAYKGEFIGEIAATSFTKVFSASLSELDLWPEFNYQLLFYTHTNKKPLKPLEFTIQHKSKDFSGSKQTVSLLKKQAWLFRMDEPEIKIDAQKLRESFFKLPEEKPTVAKPLKEIDLHIEKLRDDYQFLDKQEILRIQINYFKKSMDAGLVHKYQNMIFIHGVGNGTLRYEIQKIISKHPQVKTYKDAQKEKFGYGATEVLFKFE